LGRYTQFEAAQSLETAAAGVAMAQTMMNAMQHPAGPAPAAPAPGAARFCQACGHGIPGTARFCPDCGKP
jgi:membrane protease subunit (stomatin/prohibitin family)